MFIKAHDVGGEVGDGDLTLTEKDREDRELEPWEKRVDAIVALLFFSSVADKPFSVHMLRREIEGLPPDVYKTALYYEKWLFATIRLCQAHGLFTHQEFEAAFHKILPRDQYQDKVGVVELCCAAYENPTLMSLGLQGPKQPLYRVRFPMSEVWGESYQGPSTDTIDVEIYHNWLERVEEGGGGDGSSHDHKKIKVDHDHHEEGGGEAHDHDHPHPHQTRREIEKAAQTREPPMTTNDVLTQALLDVLSQKGSLTMAAVQGHVNRIDSASRELLGAVLIAEAWKDPQFRDLLLHDAKAACDKLGVDSGSGYVTLHVVANTPEVHNVVVCTLCSCYPRALLGIPPDWYKSYKYRSRVVVGPRAVLKELGLELPDGVRVQVHDSTADLRYLVLPMPPPGCHPQEERWTREALKALVTRDCCIGVAVPQLAVERA